VDETEKYAKANKEEYDSVTSYSSFVSEAVETKKAAKELLRREIDLAVHSAKDMSAELPPGLDVAAVLPREDPRDALVLPARAPAGDIDGVLGQLGAAPTIGTSSVRRAAQLAALLPRASFAPIRGNVDTRLRKLDEGQFAGLVLAAAGMRRLGFGDRISAAIPIDRCVPAPGQGIVAIEIRTDDGPVREALTGIGDPAAAASLLAERAVVTALGGGCQLPLGAISLHEDGDLQMHGVVASPDGRRVVRRQARGSGDDPARVGAMLADALARGGATEILDEVRRAQGPIEGSY
jgi:hydroxymethylbilane synthase